MTRSSPALYEARVAASAALPTGVGATRRATSLPSPADIAGDRIGLPVADRKYLVNPRSIIMLYYDYAAIDQAAE